MADRSPDTYLESHGKAHPLMIDEAQKAPNLFDAIKLRVDEAPHPGQYVLLGSTEFSREVLVRESLTGRLGRVRIFPMNYQELRNFKTSYKQPSRREFLEYLERGGMPGIAFVRGQQERSELVSDWLRLICYRDLDQFKKMRLDGDLAMAVFEYVSKLEHPTLSELARAIRVGARKLDAHLRALEQLFAIYKIPIHPSARGKKAIYLPLDAAIAAHFGAPLRRKMQIFLLNERFCHNHYSGNSDVRFFYYRSRTVNSIDLIEEVRNKKPVAYQILATEDFNRVDFELMKAFLSKNKNSSGILFAPVKREKRVDGFTLTPWEKMIP